MRSINRSLTVQHGLTPKIDTPGTTSPARSWVHPCNCTLIAHEECLLQWIQSAQEQRGRLTPTALRCPQCGARYELASANPLLLQFLDLGTALGNFAGKLVTISCAAGAIGCLGTGASRIYIYTFIHSADDEASA